MIVIFYIYYMKYLKRFNENKSIVTSKAKSDTKNLKEDLESIFFEMIINDLKGYYAYNLSDLLEDMNQHQSLDDWIHWIQKYTNDTTKRLIGGYFQKYYFYIKKLTEQKKRLKEYVKTELTNYVTNNS